MVLKMKMIPIKKHGSKLKIWSVEMPNAPYSNRSKPLIKHCNIQQILFYLSPNTKLSVLLSPPLKILSSTSSPG